MFADVWWFILLPVLFGLGWFAARIDARDSSRDGALPSVFFKGLNDLLNEQPTKAIDAFVEVVELEPETIELHFVLGKLFRRQGETERAIRVHKNLVARSDITAEQREQALYELGQDYLKSGLLDRAEETFDRLTSDHHQVNALTHRLRIAQMVRDWAQAVDLAQQIEARAASLPDSPAGNMGSVIAHFHCEQATVQAGKSDHIAAQASLSEACSADPTHIRPSLLRGDLAFKRGEPTEAIAAWKHAFELDPQYGALVAREWLDAHQQQGSVEAGIGALEALQREQPSVDVLTALHTIIAQDRGAESGDEYLRNALKVCPSLLGYQQLVSARLEHDKLDEVRHAELELSQQLIRQQVDRLSRYVCGHCGFSARRYYWQCAGCSQWDSYIPRRAEELERG